MLLAQTAFTPVGKPEVDPIPVAPVVVWVIATSGVFIHRVGAELALLAVFAGVKIIVPVDVVVPQPPVKVTV